MNIAPLLTIRRANLTLASGEPPFPWQRAAIELTDAYGVNIDLLNESMDDAGVGALFDPLSWEDLTSGSVGIAHTPYVPPDWHGEPGPEREDGGWWPEAVLLADEAALFYPADAAPYPTLGLFAPFTDLGLAALAVLEIALPAPPVNRARIVPMGDGSCGYVISGSLAERAVGCTTLRCEHDCGRVATALDGGRRAITCEC
jgi:hypothetical protein